MNTFSYFQALNKILADISVQSGKASIIREEKSNRTSLITFIGDRIAAVRWNQFRIYPMKINMTGNNPEVGGYLGTISETAGFPQIYNIEADPKERVDIGPTGGGWIMGPYLQTIFEL